MAVITISRLRSHAHAALGTVLRSEGFLRTERIGGAGWPRANGA